MARLSVVEARDQFLRFIPTLSNGYRWGRRSADSVDLRLTRTHAKIRKGLAAALVDVHANAEILIRFCEACTVLGINPVRILQDYQSGFDRSQIGEMHFDAVYARVLEMFRTAMAGNEAELAELIEKSKAGMYTVAVWQAGDIIYSQAAEAIEATDGNEPTQAEQHSRRGRKKLSPANRRKYLDTIAEWEKYRDSGTGSKKEFCIDKGIKPKQLDAMMAWRRNPRNRSANN